MATQNFDTCTSFYLQNGAVLGRIVRLNNVLQEILNKHKYPANVANAVAETTALAVLCASRLKFQGLFTLQMQGKGPVSLIVSDITTDGKIRSTAKFDEQKLDAAKSLRKTQDIIEETPHLIGGGYLALTIDEQNGLPPYQGVVDLQGKNLSEIALRYFKNSEQTDTIIKLFVKNGGANKQPLAGGIILQKIPLKGGRQSQENQSDITQTWEDCQAFIDTLKSDEMLDFSLSQEQILHRLFHQQNLVISDIKSYKFGCRCSREKLKKTLLSFGSKELETLYNNEGKIEATCHFCSQKYIFEKDEFETKQKNLQ